MMETNATAERLGGAQRGEGRVSIRPTVLIGLGGTGKEVLRRLRRMFYEKYRMVGLPVTEYLWFDTDIRNIDIMRNDTDLLDRRIDFSAREKIDGRVMPQELEGYRNNKGMYPHIWSWFPEALDSLPSTAITQGAGQIRPCGRLAFFHHYDKLREEIERKVNRVQSAEARTETVRIFPEYDADPNDLEIVLVTSIAGGTGSGSFIDMGFLCRDLFPNAVCTAYLVLPSVFDGVVGGARQTTRANGFAALKELEHYMQPHFDAQSTGDGHFTQHKFEWDGREHRVPAPPFSTVYLLDDSNLAGIRIADFTDVFQMISEFLLLDFEQTYFAMDKRSVRSNMEQFLAQMVRYKSNNYVQYFPCRYASFGLSQMEINQPRLANAASHKFAQYLVDFIIAAENKIPPGFSTADVRPHLEQINLTTDQLIDRALNRPGADFTLADHAINEILKPVFTDLQQSILKAPEAQDVVVLERQVVEAKSKVEGITLEIQQKVAEKLKEEGTIKGDDIKQILDNVDQLLPELEAKVEDYCIDMLCNPLECGPNYVEKFLEYGKEALASVLRDLNRLANEQMEGPRVSSIDIEFSEDFRLFEQRLKEAEDLLPPWRNKAIRHYENKKAEAFREDAQKIYRDLRDQVDTTQQELSDWVRKRFCKDAARFLVDLVERIISRLGSRAEVTGDDGKVSIKVSGLQAQIQSFRNNLQEMSRDFSEIHLAYTQRKTGERNLNLTPDLNYPEEIQNHLLQVKKWQETDLPRLCRGGLEKYFRSEEAKTLFANIATAQGEDIDTIKAGTREIFKRSANRDHSPRNWDAVRETIDDYTFQLFRDFKTDIHATGALRNRFADQEQDEIVKRSQRAEPRVSETRLVLPGLVDDISDNRIGVMDDAWVNRVNHFVAPSKGQPYQATEHRPDAIVFVNQWMAFPILSIGNIFDLDRDYRANTEANPINVFRRHMIKDYWEFTDILPPQNDGEVRALINAQSSLLNGLIMGIISYNDSQKGFYRPFRQRGIEDLDRYGHNLERARLIIGSKSDAKDRLDIAIRTMEDQWRRENRDECFIQRLALKSWLLNKVFPSTQIRVGSRDISADHTFRILLETSYHSDYDQALKQFNLSEAILDEKLEKLRNEIGTFATPLSYRDQFCNDDIYVMK